MGKSKQSSKQQEQTGKARDALALQRAQTTIRHLNKCNTQLQRQINNLKKINECLRREKNDLTKQLKQSEKKLKKINNNYNNDQWQLTKLHHKLVSLQTIKSCSNTLSELIEKELLSVTNRLRRKLSYIYSFMFLLLFCFI